MKVLLFTPIILFTLYAQAPSQNSQLNAISPTGTSKKSDGALQNSLDNWFKDDWNPVQEKNRDKEESLAKKKKEDNSTAFKLQDYVDKWEHYNKMKEKEPKSASHTEMINTLPAIGK